MRPHPRTHVVRWQPALGLLALLPAAAAAQGTAADYERAERLRARLESLSVTVSGAANWVDSSGQFWYRRSVRGANEFVLYDAATGERRVAFEPQRLAQALSAATRRSFTAATLPDNALTLVDGGRAVELTVDSTRWRCKLAEYECAELPPRAGDRGARGDGSGAGLFGERPPAEVRPRRSPDGKWEAIVVNYNVHVRRLDTAGTVGASSARRTIPLSTDGTEADAYTLQSVVWSPDSRKLAAYRVRPGYRREVHFVESSPEDQLQPKHSTRAYNKPGDVLDIERPVLFDVEKRTQIVVDPALFPNAYDVTPLVWRKDSRAVTFEYNQRGHQVYRIIEVDAATGRARAVVSEEPRTFFSYSGKRFRFDLADGKEIVWMSERDGWNHLYLYDGATGRVKNQITRGAWVVRGVEFVDTLRRQIVFRASGMRPNEDPYFVHYYRINLDGTGLTPLTSEPGTHTVTFSSDRKFYVDTWSRVDLAPISQLRRASDGAVVSELERGDYAPLLATGWRPPEPFVAKGRDGRTDIWGIIIRPTTFDSTKRYPVIENIYAGPHGSFVPKSFGLNLGMQTLAELGFIVVQIDGMGTSNRSKAFHDVAWKNLGDAGFPDRILWHKAVAAKYPWYDTSRVGIYGTSAGGQSAMGALLFHPEFYKAAVSASGCHDNRMDKIWWNEQWMGWPIGPQYDSSSNVVNAHRLRGKLLLIVGEMDTNVDPSSTYQVVNALVKAKKSFDLLAIPGAGHTDGGPYGQRKRWDFFVHNVLGVEPPDWNAVADTVSANGQP